MSPSGLKPEKIWGRGGGGGRWTGLRNAEMEILRTAKL